MSGGTSSSTNPVNEVVSDAPALQKASNYGLNQSFASIVNNPMTRFAAPQTYQQNVMPTGTSTSGKTSATPTNSISHIFKR